MAEIKIAWGGHRNGLIPSSALRPIAGVQGLEYLESETLTQFALMKLAHDADTGRNLRVNAGYRALGTPQESSKLRTQWAFWKRYREGWGNLAAYPGNSNHGFAKSVDLYDYDLKWLRKNAAAYGFENDVPSEGWHWTRTIKATITPVVIASRILEADVSHVRNVATNQHIIIDAFGADDITKLAAKVNKTDLIDSARAGWGKEISVDNDTFRILVVMANTRGDRVRHQIKESLK